MLEKDLTGLLLTDAAGGFLPGVPFGCSRMPDHLLRGPTTPRFEISGNSGTPAYCERLPAGDGAA
jgi:hypothetical protein